MKGRWVAWGSGAHVLLGWQTLGKAEFVLEILPQFALSEAVQTIVLSARDKPRTLLIESAKAHFN